MKRAMIRRHKLMEEKTGRRLAKKMVAGLMSAQVFLSPLSGVAYASEITKANDVAGAVTVSNGVYNVLADRMVGSATALNHFSNFSLDQGNIANLYFGTSFDGSATNLINFVDSRIDVNGVVNAIRNSQVGGNLYFLSVDGMTVGATGAVNAGSINIMTPTKSAFDSLVRDAYAVEGVDLNAAESNQAAVNDVLNVQYAINPAGTISVAGKMNAPDGIIMKSANINLESGAVLNTAYTEGKPGIDFSSLVNTTDANGNNVSAEITGGTLSATEGKNGDIILAAVASSSASAPGESDWENFLARTREATITTAEDSNITARGDATLSALATIKPEGWSSDGGYNAGITNPLGEVSKAIATVKVDGDITAQTINVKAEANAKYNSANDANTVSEITGDLDKMGRWTESYNSIKEISDTLNVNPIYSYLESEAKVTVGKNAKLTSTTTELSKPVENPVEGGPTTEPVTGVNIVASSTTDNTVAAASSSAEAPSISVGKSENVERGSKEDEAKNGQGNNTAKTTHLLGAAVSYGGAYSTAEVKVEGTVDSKATVNVEADANDYGWAKAVENGARDTSHGTAPYFNAGIAVLTAGNTANVEIADTAKITSEKSGVAIKAVMENEFDAEVSVQENANAIGSTSISILQTDTDANVTVNGKVSAGDGDVVIDSSNIFYRNHIYNDNGMSGTKTSVNVGENGIEMGTPAGQMTQAEGQNAAIKPEDLTTFVGKLKNKFPDIQKKLNSATDYLSVGAAISVGVETNDANVTVGNTAEINAPKGNIDVNAKMELYDTHMEALGNMTNETEGQKTGALVGASVLFADLKNNAKVDIRDGMADVTNNDGNVTENPHARLNAKSVNVNAASIQNYDRVYGLMDDWKFMYSNLANLGKDLEAFGESEDVTEEFKSNAEAFGNLYNDIKGSISKTTGLNIADYSVNLAQEPQSIAQFVMMGLSLVAGIQHAAASIQNGALKAEVNKWVKTTEEQFLVWLTPESYMNFVAGSSVGMESTSNKTAALSGAANINLLQNNAEVHIGDNAVLNATEGPVSVGTDVRQTTVVMNGVTPVSISDKYLVDLLNDLLYTQGADGKTHFTPIIWKQDDGKWGWDQARKEKLLSDLNPKNLVDVNLTASGANAVGGIAGVSQHDAKGVVIVDDGAQLTGHDKSTTDGVTSGVNIEAKNDKVLTDISLTAGKAGTVGMEGIFAWAGGNIENNIDISGGAKLTSYAVGTGTDKFGDVNVLGQADAIFTNVGGGAMWGSAGSTGADINAAVGATVTLTDADVKNIVNVGGGNGSGGSIDAHSVNVNALTDGVINTIAIAGSASTAKGTGSTKANGQIDELEIDEETWRIERLFGDDVVYDEEGYIDYQATMERYGDNHAEAAQDKANENVEEGNELAENKEQGSNNPTGTPSSSPELQLASAGSVALNIGTADTKAIISGETINLHDGTSGDKAVNVKAEDAIYSGAYAGSAAMTWKQGNAFTKDGATVDGTRNTTRGDDTVLDGKTGGAGVQNGAAPNTGNMRYSSSLSMAMAGAAAINATNQDVTSRIEDTTINDADKVQNIAQKDGATVAAAVAGALSNSSGNLASNFAGAGSASLNASDNDVIAEISGSDIYTTANGEVKNIAYDSDTQVAGGVNVEFARGGKMSLGIGGSMAFNDVQNNVSAKIDSGSKITSRTGTDETPGGKVWNHAAVNLTQVGAAVGISAVTGQGKGVAIDGTLSSNSANNKIYAAIDKAAINASSIDNAAYDAGDLKKTHDQTLEDSGVNATVSTYMDNVTQNAATEGENSDETHDISDNDYDISVEENKSTKQFTTAFSVAVDTQSSAVALAGAAAVGVLQNDLEATITDSTINTPGEVRSAAESNALMVNLAAGVAVSARGLFGGAGSASGQYTDNKTLAAIDDSTVKADAVTAEATSKDLDVNLAGQASWGKVGGGLAVAFNHQDNAASAYMRGDTIDEYKAGDGVAVSLSAKNNGQAFSIGAGVSGGTEGAANGSLAINQGRDDLNAVIDETVDTSDIHHRMKIDNARSVSAKVSDKSLKVAIAGAINGAGTAAVGGAVAFNEIGNWRKDNDYTFQQENQQQAMAAVNNADVTTISKGSDDNRITVSASDDSTLGTAATGVGGAGTAAVEGAAAVSVIGRESYALMTNTNITPAQDTNEIAVNLSSRSEGSIYNNALVGGGAGNAEVGAGVAVDYDSSDATAQIAGGTIRAANVDVLAESKDKILNIGVGGGGSGNAAVNGSVAVNILAGHTEANIIGNTTYDHGDNDAENDVAIGDAKIASDGNVIVSAQRSGSIDNIAGLAAGSGVGASVGLTVGVNDIQNATSAKISGENTEITATGNGTAEAVADTIKDGQFLTDYPGNVSGSIQPAHYMERKDSSYKGVAVSASSTNEIHSWDLNIAGNGEGAAVTGNINVNTIGGSTAAAADAKSIDAGTGDINVVAHDYANNTAYVGSLSGAGLGGALGVGSTTLTVDRDVSATAAGQGNDAKLTAKDIGVKSDAEYAVGNITAAIAVAGVVGLGNVDNITLLQGTSTASLDNYDAELGGKLDVNANHGTNIYTIGITGTGGAVAGGLGIDDVRDESETKAELKNGSIKPSNDSTVSVKANNVTNDTYMMYTLGAGGVSANGNVSVGNFNASVDAIADGVNVGSGTNRAKSVDVSAANTVSVTPTNWAGGAAGLAVGVGVQVATIGSDVNATVNNSNFYANDIHINSRDDRTAELILGNTSAGGGSAILNVGVLTAGHKVENTYAIDSTDVDGNTVSNDSGANLAYVFDATGTVNTAIEGNRLTADKSMGTGQSAATVKTSNGADKNDTSKADENTINTSVTGSTLDAGSGDVSIQSDSIINAKEQNINAAAAVTVSASGQVSVLDAARNASVDVTGSNITGRDVTVGSNLSGSSEIDTYQGSAASTALAGAFGFLRDASVSNVSLTGNTITASNNVTAKTTDTSKSGIDAFAVQPALGFAGSFQLAEADIVGSSTVNLGAGNKIEGANIEIAATNAQDVTTNVKATNDSLVIAGSVSVSTIEIGDENEKYNTALTVADDNTFIAPTINLSAEKNTKETATMKALSVSSGGVVVNYATAQDYSSVSANVGKAQYGDGNTQATLTVSAENKTVQTVDAASANADLFAAVANNTAKIDNIMDTKVSADGTKDGTNLKKADIAAASNTTTDADSSTFGGSLVNVAAAETELDHVGNTTAKVLGSWTTEDSFTVSAKNDEKLNLDVDTASASVVGGSGGGLDANVKQKAAVTAENATVTTGKDQNFIATNTADDNSRMDSSGFGFLDSVDATRLDSHKTYSGNVNLKNATLTANDGSNINAYAAALGSHTTDNEMVAVSAGVDEAMAYTYNHLTYDNDVTAAGSTLKTTGSEKAGNVTLAAYDNTTVDETIMANSEGFLAGVSCAHLDTTLTRTNDVKLTGNTTVTSAGDANLYASRDETGNRAGTTLNALTDTYNRTLLPVGNSADIDLDWNQANVVTVDAGSKLQSVQDIHLAADSGADARNLSSTMYVWYTDSDYDGSVTVTESGVKNNDQEVTNNVTIGGTATAGLHNAAKVKITGKVTANEDETVNFDDIKVEVTEGGDWLKAGDFTTTVYAPSSDSTNPNIDTKEVNPYVNPYYENYASLVEAQKEYPPETEAYKEISYQIASLCEAMAKLGYADRGTDGSGNTVYTVYKTCDIAAVIMPDITVSGGNVDVQADALNVTGSLSANHGSTIEVDNQSSISLVVNDAIIPKAGGIVYFNNASVNSASGGVPGLTGAANIHAAAEQDVPAISIKNTGAVDQNLGHTPDIDVRGTVKNENGSVSLSNANGSIKLEATAEVSGLTVNIQADNGNVVQDNPEGIVNVGGDPIEQWMGNGVDGEANQKAIQNVLHWKAKSTDGTYSCYASNYEQFRSEIYTLVAEYNNAPENFGAPVQVNLPETQPGVDASSGIHAGGLVAISGHEVNVNGLIQSGYTDYTVNLAVSAATRIEDFDNGSSDPSLTDSAVKGNAAYCIDEGGAYFDNQAGCWKYHVPVYYNPVTKHIVVSDVSASGGSVTITGNVGSTGNGRIYVATGAANIDIDTTVSGKEVVLGSITNKDRTGEVRIVDSLKDETYDKHFSAASEDTYQVYDSNADRLKYSWTGGVSESETVHYTSQTDSWLWGLFESDSEIKEECKKNGDTKVSTTENHGDTLPASDFFKVREPTDPNAADEISIVTNYKQETTGSSDLKTEKDEKGLFGWIKTVYTYSWDEYVSEDSTTLYNLNANHDISIRALQADKAGIKATSQGNLIVGSNITSAATKAGNVILKSNSGSVKGDGVISTNNLTVKAATGIDVNHAAVKTTDTSDTDYLANVNLAATGGDIQFRSAIGDLNIQNITASGAGATADVRAKGNVLNGAADGEAAVTADRIAITADNGTIGTADKALTVNGGQTPSDPSNPESAGIGATAYGGVYLMETAGDMRIDQIESKTGDVVLTATNGSIVNASSDTKIDGAVSDSLVQKWYNAGIISNQDAEDSNTNSAAHAKEIRLKGMTMRFRQLALESDSARTAENYETAANAYANDPTLNAAREEYISVLKGTNNTAAVAAAKNAYKAAIEDYFVRTGETYSDSEKTAISNYGETLKDGMYGWSKNDLANALKESLVNRKPGTVSLPEEANVKGATVTLNAGGGIGTTGAVKTYSGSEITVHIGEIKNAQPGSIDVRYDAGGKMSSITIDESKPLYVETTDARNTEVKISSAGQTYLGTTVGRSLTVGAAAADKTIGSTEDNAMFLAENGLAFADGTVINAKDLTLLGGSGSIGTDANKVGTNITGTLTANSAKSIFVNNTGESAFTLSSIAAGDDVHIASKGNMDMESDTSAESSKNNTIINAGNTINLSSENGSIGGENAIRVKGNDAAVSAAAENGNVAVNVSTAGNITLDDIQAKNLSVTNETGNILLCRSADAAEGKTGTNANIAVESATLAARSIDLTDGIITAAGTGAEDKLAFIAEAGITQRDTKSSAIHAADGENVVFRVGTTGSTEEEKSAGTLSIASKNNTFDTASVLAADGEKGISGAITLVTNAPNTSDPDDHDGLSVTFGSGDGSGTLKIENGDVLAIKNESLKGDLSIGGKLEADSGALSFINGGSINVINGAELSSAGDFTLWAGQDVTIDGTITTRPENNTTLVAERGSVNFAEGEIDTTNATLTAGQDVTIKNIKASENVKAAAGRNLTVNGDVEAGGTAVMAAESGALAIGGENSGKITAGDVDLLSGSTLSINGEVSSEENVKIIAKSDIDIRGAVVSGTGATSNADGFALISSSNGSVQVHGAIAAKGDALVSSVGDTSVGGGIVSANGDVDLLSGNTLSINGDVAADGKAVMAARSGALTIGDIGSGTSGKITAGDVDLLSGSTLSINGEVSSEENVKIIAKSDIDIRGAVASGTDAISTADGFAMISSSNGSVNVLGAIDSKGDALVSSVSDTSVDGGIVSANGDVNVSGRGDTTVNGVIKAEKGSATVYAGKDATVQGYIAAKHDVEVNANGNADVEGKITSSDGDVTFNARSGDAKVVGFIDASKGSLSLAAGNDVMVGGDAKAGETASISSANGGINVNGKVEARDVYEKAKDDLEVRNIAAVNNIEAVSDGNMTLTDSAVAGNSIILKAKADATIAAAEAKNLYVTAGRDITADAVTAGATNALDGNLYLDAGKELHIGSDPTAGNNLTLISRGGDIDINSATATSGSAAINANGSIQVDSLNAGNNVVVDGNGTGEVTLANVAAGRDAVIRQNGSGSLSVDRLTAGDNASFAAQNGNMKLSNVTATNGSTTINANGRIQADSLNAGNNVVVDGNGTKNSTLANVAAGHDAVIRQNGSGNLSVDRLTTGDNASFAARNGTMELSDVTATNGNATINASGSIQLDSLNAGVNVVVESNSTKNSTLTNVAAGRDAVIRQNGIGNMDISNVTAAGNATINSNGSIQVDSLNAGNNVVVDGNGTGEVTLANVAAGHDAVIKQNGNGDLSVDGLTAGDIARFVAQDGNMDLSNVTAANRIGIFNYGRDKETRMARMSAGPLITFLAFNPVIEDASAVYVYDVLKAGDPAREAIGWDTAKDVGKTMVLEQYWFGFDRYSLGSFELIDTKTLYAGDGFRNLPEGDITVADESGYEEEDENRELFA